jgi:gamma-glutamyltranspeptidase/glutathione hydrolase
MFVNPDGSNLLNAAGTSALAQGGLAVAVPHEVAGMLFLLENYGTMTREQVITPALRMAAEGWVVTVRTRSAITGGFDLMTRFTPYNVAPIYMDPADGMPVEEGTVINNPGFARALQRIIDYGLDGFYKGPVAEALVATVQRHGGIITMEDLANVRPRLYQPTRSFYRGYEIISSSPPSSGGAMLSLMLNMLEHFDVGSFAINSAEYINLWTEVQKHAYAHRAQFIADPRFFNVPLEGLLSEDFAAYLASKVVLGYANHNVVATDWFDISPFNPPRLSQAEELGFDPVIIAQGRGPDDPWSIDFREIGNTTHYSVADRYGNMVSVTKTLNSIWGSGVMIDEFGFFLNNEMASGFINNPNSIQAAQPNMVPVSSMSPTIVLDSKGNPFMVLGTPGATRIFTTVAQVISRVIDHGMNVEDAVSIPYFWNIGTGPQPGLDQITIDTAMPGMERFAITPQIMDRLVAMGHRRPTVAASGSIQLILYQDGRLYGMSDPRADGRSVGF